MVKASGSTGELLSKLPVWRTEEETGTSGVAVKCVDIGRNANSEGRFLVCS
jgi:hypothetical protein